MKTAALWRGWPEWGKAFVIAVAVLLFTHLFVLRFVTVRSISMFATLVPGDLVAVVRWPIWTGLHRGDVLVFHDPLQDDLRMGQRRLLVKRIVAVGGDVVELQQGQLLVNGMPADGPATLTNRWTVQVKDSTDVARVLEHIGLAADMVLPGHTVFDLPLNNALAARLRQQPGVLAVREEPGSRKRATHLFPYGPNFKWNNDNYGPLRVPAKGDTVQLDLYNLPIYDRLMAKYEGAKIEVAEKQLLVNGQPNARYVVQHDYYFVLGDSRDHSEDSRYWGFVPKDHAVGRAACVVLNAQKPNAGQGRRVLLPL